MIVLAVDPGPELSAWVLWDGERVIRHGKDNNVMLTNRIYQGSWGDGYFTHSVNYVFEQVASYGMPVGAEVFETVFWTGRLYQEALGMLHRDALLERVPRRDVKLHLCGQVRAKDSNVRQALINRFGGKDAAIGKKATPGPLYGLRADEWQALALAVTFYDQRVTEPQAVRHG